ncbi:sigma-54-dependent Fis family transcriptional regulator [Streptomyces sp. NPDC058947]|uniref:sigma-54-dependent Fis family transcriptional regulator n=1 Tax=Streptomyces sp. NPDC058947 TaxID=3346675 RepID=UPI00367704B0
MTTTDPSPTPARPSLRLARERFLSGEPLPGGVPEEVVAAWRRARFFGVPHDLNAPAACAERPADSALLTAARPVLDRIVPALDADALLVLTDERLRVLWTAGRVPGAAPCPVLAEQEVGHNSAALALRTRRRAEVHGPEHFLDRWQDVSAVSVPVLSPDSGQVLGTLTVAARLCATRAPHPRAALAEAAAAAIETELRARSGRAEQALLDAYLRASRGRDRAVAALDGHSRLINEAAQRLLTPEVLDALERTAVHARRAEVSGPAEEPEGPSGRTTASGTGPSPLPVALPMSTPTPTPTPLPLPLPLPEGAGCTAQVTPLRLDGTVVGIVAVLEPLGDQAPVVPDPPAAAVALTGSSLPWRHAVGRAVELARSPEPLLLAGERGSGKSALARELLGPGPVQEADAAQDPGLEHALRARQTGRPLLLRHAERLAQPGVAALNSLLDARPDTPLLVTYTPGAPAGPCLQRLLDMLSARTVTLPPLRERAEDLRELLPALAPRPAPGRPPLTWTLDALRALEQYPWPGNVTELAHVVRALAEHRRMSGPVRRAELPDAVREGPAARPLSPMEHAERTTILEALRRHGGNKARAAAALGIGRATLYRKLRGYRG